MENIESGVQTLYFEYNRIQMIAIGSSPYFNLEDVCEILKIKDTKRAKARLDEQGVCDVMTFTPSGIQKMYFISKLNLNKLISHSHRREKTEFAVWVTSEVLPVFTRDKMIKNLEELRRIQKKLRKEQLKWLTTKFKYSILKITKLEH